MSVSDRNIQQVHGVATPGGQAGGHRPARGSENPTVGTIYPVVVVLGATGKVGRGIVQALVEARRPLVAVADDSRELSDLAAAHRGADLTVLTAKLAADADAERLAQELRGLGRVVGAVIVPFACEGGRGRLLDHPTSLLWRALEQDVLPQLALARQLVPMLGEAGRAGRYLFVLGPGSELPWAGYGYRSVTSAALRMLARVLHDEARCMSVRVQTLAVEAPVSSEPRGEHECSEWPSTLAVGRRAVQLLERNSPASTDAVVRFDADVDSAPSRTITERPQMNRGIPR
jgi:NAD(P)-dependent dehydrogenase (short-subunit alcohol dehydrogenase family)